MRPIKYHDGQRDVQREANSVKAADKLSTWVGPVADYATGADLIVLASLDASDVLHVAALSGPPPLVSATLSGDEVALQTPSALADRLPTDSVWGGIVINPSTARRSRLAGKPVQLADGIVVTCPIAFTNCRKYILASSSTGDMLHVGPIAKRSCAIDDAWVIATIGQGEMAFLITATPDGVADVSHRGGEPGFLHYSATASTISWTEYLGDGMFMSVGNLRARPRFALVVLELETGDAVLLEGEAHYTNVRTDRHERVDALIQASESFPVQGRLEAAVQRVARLEAFCLPRVRVERRARITSSDGISVQHPQ